jgi:dihydroorotase
MEYLTPIDPHVHLRWNEHAVPYIDYAYQDAQAIGMAAMYEMPNTNPPLTNPQAIETRAKWREPEESRTGVRAGINVGLTNDLEQVAWAAGFVDKGKGIGKSLKAFWTHSTGNMGIMDPAIQRQIWQTLAQVGYRGTVIQHCEDEGEWRVPYDFRNPISHSLRQNPESETIQVERQLRNAVDAKFRGVFYIAHVSNPATIYFVRSRSWPFEVVMEFTWHHLFLNYADYQLQGNRVKMNPPLRSQALQEGLLDCLLGRRPSERFIIGSDHAPHSVASKDGEAPPSGIPALPFWPRGVEKLRKLGMKQDLEWDITFFAANRYFGLGCTPKPVTVEYRPELWDKYGWNPFSRVEEL